MWTKSCALYAFSDLNDYTISNDLIAHLYNPNDILRQTAAYSISVHNKDFFEKIGYRISLVRLEGNNSVSYETFADGWLNGDTVSGRPVDIELMPDGSMLVSDDYADCIYRITYE